MTRRLRQWLLVGAGLAVLVAAGLAIALYRLNAYLHDHRDILAAQASATLGRTVRFGTVGVSLHDGVSARLTDLSVAEDPRFGDGNFLRAANVYVAIDVLPALIGRYRIRHLRLEEPAVTIIRTTSGTNIGTLGGPPARASALPEASTPPRSDEPRGAALASLLIASASVRGGRVDVIDRRVDPPAEIGIDHLEASAGDIALDRAMRFELHAALLGAVDRNLVVVGTLDPRPPNALDIQITLGPIALDGLRRIPDLGDILPSPLQSADPISASLHLTGSLDTLSIALDADASAGTVRYGALFSKPPGVPLTLTGEADAKPASARVDVRVVQLALGAAVVRARGHAEGVSPTTIDATAELAPVALAELAAWVPALIGCRLLGTVGAELEIAGKLTPDQRPEIDGRIELHNGGADGLPFSLHDVNATITIATDRVALQPTMVWLGEAPVALACDAALVHAPVLTCTATAERLAPAALGVTAAAADDVLRALALTAAVQAGAPLRAELRSGSGVLHGIAYRDLQTTLRIEPGRTSVDALSVRAFEGSAAGSGSLTIGSAAAPEVRMRTTIDDMRLAPLLASQRGGAARQFDGRLHADATLAGTGGDWLSLRNSVRGTARIGVTDGVLRDVNVAAQILDSLGGLGGLTQLLPPRLRERYPGIFRSGDTRFDALGATVRIADGRAVTDDARLRATDFAVDGRGTVSLDGRLALRGTFAASPGLTKDLIGGRKEASGLVNRSGQLEVPFSVGGTVENVQLQPDRAFVARAVQQALVGEGLNALLGKSAGHNHPTSKPSKPADQLLQKGLEKLFGR